MKKLLFTIILSLSVGFLSAQVGNYLVTVDTSDTYTEITDGTVLGEKLYDNNFHAKYLIADTGYNYIPADAVVIKGIPLGFDLKYGTNIMNQLVINTNGLITLGLDSVKVGYYNNTHISNTSLEICRFSLGNMLNDSIFATQKDITAENRTQISYKVEGNAGSKVFIVQYKNLLAKTSTSDLSLKDTINFQIRISEADHSIKIVYGKHTMTGERTNLKFTTAINGVQSCTGLQTAGSPLSWSSATKTTYPSAKMTFKSDCVPSANLSYSFTPNPCLKPATALTDIVITKLTGQEIVFTAHKKTSADNGGNGVLILMSSTSTLNTLPVDGTDYSRIDSIGNAKIVKVSFATGATTTLSVKDLQPTTAYHFFGYTYNSQGCSSGFTYSATSTDSTIYTSFNPPSAEVIVVDTNSATLKISASGRNVILAKSTSLPTKAIKIETVPEVGSILENGFTVVAVGQIGEEYKVEELKNGTTYFFQLYSYETEPLRISADFTALNTFTSIRAPYNFDLTVSDGDWSATNGKRPAGWSTDERNATFHVADWEKMITAYSNFNGIIGSIVQPQELYNMVISVTSPEIIFQDNNRYEVTFDYEFNNIPATINSYMGADISPVPLSGSDKLQVYYSANGGAFVPAEAAITASNQGSNGKGTGSAIIKGHAGEKVKFKFSLSSSEQSITALIDSVSIKPFVDDLCENINSISVIDTSISTTSMNVSWKSYNPVVSSYLYKYKKTGDSEFSQEFATTNSYAILTNLTPNSLYSVAVKAQCPKDTSDYTSSTSLYGTKYSLPYFEKFDLWTAASSLLPHYNKFNTTMPASGSIDIPKEGNAPQWKIEKGEMNATFSDSSYGWFVLPTVNINSLDPAFFSFKSKLINNNTNVDLVIDPSSVFAIYVSKDGGKTFNSSDTLLVLKADALKDLNNSKIHFDLSKYNNMDIRLGFYYSLETQLADNYSVSIDSLSLDYTCANTITSHQVSGITPYLANISWKETGAGNTYRVSYKKEADVSYTTIIVRDTILELTELAPNTKYVYTLETMCDGIFHARMFSGDFSTLALPICSTPTNLNATVIERTSAELTWDNVKNAILYNISYKPTSQLNFRNDTTSANSYKLESLNINTAYVWKVQSKCMYDLLSDFSANSEFSTPDTVSNDSQMKMDNLKVYAKSGQIHILNPSNVYVSKVILYSIEGRKLIEYPIFSAENMILSTSYSSRIAMIQIIGKQSTKTFKVYLP